MILQNDFTQSQRLQPFGGGPPALLQRTHHVIVPLWNRRKNCRNGVKTMPKTSQCVICAITQNTQIFRKRPDKYYRALHFAHSPSHLGTVCAYAAGQLHLDPLACLRDVLTESAPIRPAELQSFHSYIGVTGADLVNSTYWRNAGGIPGTGLPHACGRNNRKRGDWRLRAWHWSNHREPLASSLS